MIQVIGGLPLSCEATCEFRPSSNDSLVWYSILIDDDSLLIVLRAKLSRACASLSFYCISLKNLNFALP